MFNDDDRGKLDLILVFLNCNCSGAAYEVNWAHPLSDAINRDLEGEIQKEISLRPSACVFPVLAESSSLCAEYVVE